MARPLMPVNRAMAHPANSAGMLATSSSRTSIPMRSKLYGSRAKSAIITTAPIPSRRATWLPDIPQAMPNSAENSSSATWGLQKQFWPGQADSVLYCPMTSCPPSTRMTVQSAPAMSHFSPNHSAATVTASDTTVRTVLNLELNRLARSHPMTPHLRPGRRQHPAGACVSPGSHH